MNILQCGADFVHDAHNVRRLYGWPRPWPCQHTHWPTTASQTTLKGCTTAQHMMRFDMNIPHINRGKILSVHSELMNIICSMEWRFSSIRSHIQLSTNFCVRLLFSSWPMYACAGHTGNSRRPFIHNKFSLFSLRVEFSSQVSAVWFFRATRKDQLFIS